MNLKTLIKSASIFGALAGLLGGALLIGMYFMGRHPLMISPFLDFRIILFAIFMFFALKDFRETEQGGTLYFSQGMIGSTVLVAVSSIVSATMLYLFGAFNTNFVASYIPLRIDYLKSFPQREIDLIGKEVFDMNVAAVYKTTIGDLTSVYFTQGLIIGFFISIILSVILRKQPNN